MVAPLVGAALISGGLQGLGGLFNSGQKMSRQQLAEQAREFNIGQQYQQEQGRSQTQMAQTSDINSLQRQLELAPTRDKVSYMLNQRMGMVPQQFQGRDMMNPGSSPQTPQLGGINSQQLQGAMGSYQAPNFMTNQAGSGGVDPRIYHAMMARLGLSGAYGQQNIGDIPIQENTYSNPWQKYMPAPPQAPGSPLAGNPQSRRGG